MNENFKLKKLNFKILNENHCSQSNFSIVTKNGYPFKKNSHWMTIFMKQKMYLKKMSIKREFSGRIKKNVRKTRI